MKTRKVYWLSEVPAEDDFGLKITDEFIDGKTIMGPWAMMTPRSWKLYGGNCKLGLGMGQRYKLNPDATKPHEKWPKVEG